MRSLRILTSAGLVVGGIVTGSSDFVVASQALTVENCVPAQLTVTLAHPQGAAGTSYYPLVFTNTKATCALWGVPSIQPVVGGAMRSRVKVGPASRNNSMGMMPVRHLVAMGHSVSSTFGVSDTGNYPANTCGARNAGAIVVTLGSFVTPSYVRVKISVCTKRTSTSSRLIVAGTSGT